MAIPITQTVPKVLCSDDSGDSGNSDNGPKEKMAKVIQTVNSESDVSPQLSQYTNEYSPPISVVNSTDLCETGGSVSGISNVSTDFRERQVSPVTLSDVTDDSAVAKVLLSENMFMKPISKEEKMHLDALLREGRVSPTGGYICPNGPLRPTRFLLLALEETMANLLSRPNATSEVFYYPMNRPVSLELVQFAEKRKFGVERWKQTNGEAGFSYFLVLYKTSNAKAN